MTPLPLQDLRRILIVKLSAIGDVVLATPVATALRQRFPDAHLGWLVEDKAQAVLAHNPDVDEVIVWKKGELRATWRQHKIAAWRQQWAFVRALRERRWDVAIDLQGLLKSAVLTYLSGARWRIGPHSGKEGASFFYTHRPFLPPERLGVYAGDRYLEMLQLLDLGVQTRNGPASVPRWPMADGRWPIFRGPDNPKSEIRNPKSEIGPASVSYPLRLVLSAEDEAFADDFLARQGIAEEDLLISLCPAAAPTFFTKFWFPARWAAVADGLRAELGARVLFHGAPHDLPLIESIVQQMTTPPVVATGQTTLLQAAALLRRSRLCVSVETGLQHFAVAVGTPVVVLLGPTVNTPPPPHVAVIKPYPCQPCARNPICRFQDGVGECLAAITVEDVLATCRRMVRG